MRSTITRSTKERLKEHLTVGIAVTVIEVYCLTGVLLILKPSNHALIMGMVDTIHFSSAKLGQKNSPKT